MCVLYRGELKNCDVCPKCSEPRFKAKNVLKRTFHYLPLSPKVIKSCGTGGISYLLLQSHGGEIGEPNNVGIMKDVHDSPKWKSSFSVCILNGDSRGIGLSLYLDGLNYSMWPIVLGQLNFSRKIRYHFANLLLVGIISSQTRGKEPKHLDPFLEVLVDEILSLSS